MNFIIEGLFGIKLHIFIYTLISRQSKPLDFGYDSINLTRSQATVSTPVILKFVYILLIKKCIHYSKLCYI